MNSFKYPNADREDVKDVLFNKEVRIVQGIVNKFIFYES